MAKYAKWPDGRLITIEKPGYTLALGENEITELLKERPDIYADALQRGKALRRAEQRRQREADADRKARRDAPCWQKGGENL